MGNTNSAHFEQTDEDAWWSNSSQVNTNLVEKETDALATNQRERNDDEFQLELERIREKRRNIIGKKKKEMDDLRNEVAKLKAENEELKRKNGFPADEENELLRRQNQELREILKEKSSLLSESENIIGKNRELKISIAEMQEELQNLNTEVLNFEKEREDYKTHVVALKDVISVSKHMLQIRESQLKELKEKVESIEKSLADREAQVLSEDLRKEYERQLGNIRNLRTLYEERQRMERREKSDLIAKVDEITKELEAEQHKTKELQERISELETDNSSKYDTIKSLESNLGLSKAECRQFQAELSVINQLFSEILLGFNNSQIIDLDKLQRNLEDHRDLLQDIVVNEISSEVSYALPKVLLDLLNQVNSETAGELESVQDAALVQQKMNSSEEIVENLPKVWRVLIELLSHQAGPTNVLSTAEDKENPCYKTVDTAKGPSLVLSVSRTFIRLKDLILEKKALEKETNHLKQLNGHLENRLQDQEKRLELVHSELSKTWLVVGTLQKQHQKLHTQEKILRYELAQKRKLLNELKEELEDSREKWAQAREKNSNTEQQWQLLRSEFASRKSAVLSEEYNISGESGYSDDREGLSSDEEPGYETDISEGAQKIPVESNQVCQKIAQDSISETDGDSALLRISDDTENEASVDVESHNLKDSQISRNEDILQASEITINQIDAIQNPQCSTSIHETHNSESQPGTSTGNTQKSQITCEKTDFTHKITDGGANSSPHDGIEDKTFAQETLTCVSSGSCGSDQKMEHSEEASTQHRLLECAQKDTSDKNVASENTKSASCDDAIQGTSGERKLTFEERLARRDERLRRLEGQASQLVSRVSNTAIRSVAISNRLDDLHEVYGQGVDEDGENVNSDNVQNDNPQ